MIVWFRHLPQINLDSSEWKPFIRNTWFRKQFMKFVYLLMVIFFLAPNWFGVEFNQMTIIPLIWIILCVFVLHELFIFL